MPKHTLMNTTITVPLLAPAAISSQRSGDWVGLEHWQCVKLTMIGTVGRSGASDDTTLTFRQAQAAAGTGGKGFTPRRAYVREGATLAAAAAATPTVVEDAESVVTNGDMVSIVEVEIDASELDLENDFTHVAARTAAVSGGTRTVEFLGQAGMPRQITAPQYLRSPLL